MEVILLERVAKLGQMGEIVKVRDGYARNFLLKRKKALRATAENRAKYDGMKAELEANNLQAKSEAAKAAEKINGIEVVIIRQASESGQLFGSVSVRDIVAALEGEKVTVGRTQVWLDAPIKAIGQTKVTIAVHPEVDERLNGLRDRGEDRDPDVFDEHLLGRGGAALHAIEHDRVGPGLDRERDVVVGARRADLDVDRDPPVGDLAQLLDLDLEVVGAGPVRVPARAALVDAAGQVAHLRDPIGDLVAEQHSAAARLGPLADHDLDRVGAPQVVGIHAIA